MISRRWDPCISNRGDNVGAFIAKFFSQPGKHVQFVAGAGFDPRSTTICDLFVASGARVTGTLIQENRPNPVGALSTSASTNAAALTAAISDVTMLSVDIFGIDGAVVGGRNAVAALGTASIPDVTDVAIDVSALSIGVSFPVVRFFVEQIESGQLKSNLHLFVTHDAALDDEIKAQPSDVPGYIHGFRGTSTLDLSSQSAKLWLPQLAQGRRSTLARLHDFVSPHDTCPILPFPASDPRRGDILAEEYLVELESSWEVDTRNIVYADEGDPLDLYRTVLTMDDLRRPVFAEVGGSMLVLSPAGSKIMALGALMAALERNLPVAYLEAWNYEYVPTVRDDSESSLVHIWLEGTAYPLPRPPLQALTEVGR